MIDEGSAQFTVHPSSGEIRSMVVFDRETQDEYNVTVLAADGGSTGLTGTAVVVVTVLDENDEEPVFSQSLYEVEILETLPVGQSVLQLSASDNDTANNSFSVFSILTSQPPDVHFFVNTTTGIIYTSSSLDRETVRHLPSYHQSGGPRCSCSPPQLLKLTSPFSTLMITRPYSQMSVYRGELSSK